jgi:hypothetical protein
MRLLEKILLSCTAVVEVFTFQGRLGVGWRWQTFQGDQQKNVEKIWRLLHGGRRATIRELADTSYAVCHEILTEMWTYAALLQSLGLTEACCCLLGLASYDFTLFPKFEMKLKGRHFEAVSDIQREWQAAFWNSVWHPKGMTSIILKQCLTSKGNHKRHFETVSDIQRESQAVLDSIEANYFYSDLEAWKNILELLCTFERRLFWREWQQTFSKLGHYSFFDLVRKLSNSALCAANRI